MHSPITDFLREISVKPWYALLTPDLQPAVLSVTTSKDLIDNMQTVHNEKKEKFTNYWKTVADTVTKSSEKNITTLSMIF